MSKNLHDIKKEDLQELVNSLSDKDSFFDILTKRYKNLDDSLNIGWVITATLIFNQYTIEQRKKGLSFFIDSLPDNLIDSIKDKNNFLKRLLLSLIPNFREKLDVFFNGTTKWQFRFYNNLQSFLDYLYTTLEGYSTGNNFEEVKKELSLKKHIKVLKLEALEHFYDEYIEESSIDVDIDLDNDNVNENSIIDLDIVEINSSKHFVSILKIVDLSLKLKLSNEDYFSLVGEIIEFMDIFDFSENLVYLIESFITSVSIDELNNYKLNELILDLESDTNTCINSSYSLGNRDTGIVETDKTVVDFLNRCFKKG